MGLIDLSIRRPVTVFIFSVAAVVFGVVAFNQLATDLLPDISYPSMTVRTEYDGAAPIEIEGLVTRPVENAVGVVDNVVRVTSSSRPDVSEVTLEFAWGTDMDLAGLDVRERLDVLRLPDAVERPVLLRYDPSLDPIVRLAIVGGDDLAKLRLIAEEEVRRRLERIEGVAAAVVSGGLEDEIQVLLDERRIDGLGLTVDRVLSRLAQENVNLTGGNLRDGRTEYLVRTVQELRRASDLDDLVLDTSGGAIVRLRDVATVSRGYRERDVITRANAVESVDVSVYKEGGTNTVRVSSAVREDLDGLVGELREIDPSIDVLVVADQATYITQSIDEVLWTARTGGLLAILVLFLFLRNWRPTLIIATAIPISVVATFFLMFASDVSLNIMSLGGLTLGIGLLVDNAIVVLEAIQRKRDEGKELVAAASEGAGGVARAVVASTLTTICVFVPVVFVEGIAGQLFGDQALTVTYSLIISLVVALTLIPMLASRRFGTDDEEPKERPGIVSRAIFALFLAVLRAIKWIWLGLSRLLQLILRPVLWLFERLYNATEALYGRMLDGALRLPLVVILVAIGLLAGSLTLFDRLGRELVPELIQGEFYADLELEPGTHLDVTSRRLAALERQALQLDGVKMIYAIAGSSNEQGGVAGELRENIAQLSVVLDEPISREREEAAMAFLREHLDAQSDIDYRLGRPAYFSFKTPVEVEVRGYNLALLDRLADALAERMRSIEGLADVKSSTEGGSPELQILFDRDRLASYGLTIQNVADIVRTKVQGTVATDIQRDDRTIDIRVRSDTVFRDSAEDLSRLTVHQVDGVAIPLAAVASVVTREGPAEIRRAEGDRVALISANLVGRDLGAVADEINAAIDALDLPSGYDIAVGGQREEMETSFGSMRLAIFLAIFMVYLVMASQFESLLHPFVILFSVPFSAIGVLVTLWLFDVNVSIVVLIGVVLLAGIVVNNAIILVDTTNQLRRAGTAKIEALRQAGRLRLRPILMTTATTVLGLLPMAIGLGAGSELRSPMAIPVIGGLITSTLLTLLVLPSVYAVLDRGK